MDRNLEKALFESFIAPKKKRRYLELLDSVRGREKIRFGLDHFWDLDPRFCHRIKPSDQHFPDILQTLKSLGAPSLCYVISSGDELDGREMELSEALRDIIGRGAGAFVSCVPGKLAYFESEDINEQYICHRETETLPKIFSSKLKAKAAQDEK